MGGFARRCAAPALIALLAMLTTACGGGDSAGNSVGSADVTGARNQIAKFATLPTFIPSGPAFDAASKLHGKTIFEIPSEVPFVSAVERGMKQAAREVGAELVVYPNQGQPSQWAQGIRTAIAQRADAIALLAQDPALLGPQIDQARMGRARTTAVARRSGRSR